MPSTSKKQHNFMAAVANNPTFAKKVGLKPSVGEHFLEADKGKKFKGGGMAESKKMGGKEVAFMKKKGAPASMIKHEESEMKAMKKMAMGGPSNPGSTPRPRGPVIPGKPMPSGMSGMPPRDIGTGAGPRRPLPQAINKPGMGGMPPRDIGTGAGPRSPLPLPFPDFGPKDYMKKGGVVASKMGSVRTASPSRDGIASKGKTRGKIITMSGASKGMKKGGKC